jgi:CHRD domain
LAKGDDVRRERRRFKEGLAMFLRHVLVAALVGFLVSSAAPALAADVAFTASLSGGDEGTKTGSKATGDARLAVHRATQTVDVALKVVGLKFADLAAHLARAPVGPMHLHLYAANGDVSLLLPFPMGPAYVETADGFTLDLVGYKYVDGAKILNSDVSFDDFLAAMKSGAVVFNIHTNKFMDGEISGKVLVAK